MVKTYVPEQLIASYNNGQGIDRKEYEFLVGTRPPTPPPSPLDALELGPPESPDFSGVLPPPPPPLPPPPPPPPPGPLPPPPPTPPRLPPRPLEGGPQVPLPQALRGM